MDKTVAYIEDILIAIGHIEADVAGHGGESFAADRRVRQLVERNVEIISEASRRIPEHLHTREDAVPWPAIRGIGNILRHEYRSVATDVLWGVVTKDIQPLKEAMRRLRDDLVRQEAGDV